MIQGKHTHARKLLGGIAAAAATSVMILGANAPAHAATTHSNTSYAPNSITTLPHCNTWMPLHRDFGYEGRGMLPYSDSAGSPNCILETGNNNSGVRALQTSLNLCYSKSIAIDGIFGTDTYNALLSVQRLIGVTIDGIYGPGTRTKMYWYGGTACHPITFYQGF